MKEKLLLFLVFLMMGSTLFSQKKNLSFKVPKNFSVSVFATKDHVNNPISIAVDSKGRVYVAEAIRFQRGVEDSRQYNKWFLDELKCHTLQDRLDLYAKWTEKGMFKKGHFTTHADRIVTVYDNNADGVADEAKEYSGGYNAALDGNGSSILLGMDGEMYYANIPHIWKITDKDGDGVSEKREEFITGFGFRSGVNGHDLHGLEWGVDGRLYFSNGDRGYGIKTKEGKTLFSSERGAIFRCEPDGSNLEVFTVGNRNPQDLAFDQYGNLFTVDNNRGRGDRSRVCYLVELGDYGWNSGHENKTTFFRAVGLNKRRGPKPKDSWIVEGDWKEQFNGQAAYCVPSICYIDGGSAGITFNPGESLGPEYDNHFVYSGYQRGIFTFKFSPNGGGLKVENLKNFWTGGHIMDTEFSADGRLFVADYVSTRNAKTGSKGGIYILKDDKFLQKKSVKSAAVILKKGFKGESPEKLYKNLFHKDMRVRLFSQFELVKRGDASKKFLMNALNQKDNELARLHGLWGMGQFSRKDSSVCNDLLGLLKDDNFQIRAQAVKVIGEAQDKKYIKEIMTSLSDKHDRVKFYAYTAVGKLGSDGIEQLIKQVELNNDKDIFLRHSAVAGLTYTGNADKIASYSNHSSTAVRRVILLSLAKLQDKRVVSFLNDTDVSIVQETIRSINRMDQHELVEAGAGHLAKYVSGETKISDTNIERVLQWNFRKGDLKSAELVSQFALNIKANARLRQIAVNDLARWKEQLPVDPVVGQIRKINENRAETTVLLKNTVKKLMEINNEKSMDSMIKGFALELKLGLDKDMVASQILDKKLSVHTRLDFYQKLLKGQKNQVKAVTLKLLGEENVKLRTAAYVGLFSFDKKAYKERVLKMIELRNDYQAIYQSMTKLQNHGMDSILVKAIRRLAVGKHPEESSLDLILAAEKSKDPAVKKVLVTYKKSIAGNQLAEFAPTMHGGDAANGRKLVYEQGVGQCIICHKVEGKGGIVAPDLSDIASKKHATGKYLVESLIQPSAHVVPGFGNITVTLRNGSSQVGSLLKDDGKKITLKFIDGKTKSIDVADIKTKTKPLSSMPPMGAILKKTDIRDIIAYLKTLKKKAEH